MRHFHYPDGRVLGAPHHSNGEIATIGRHTGTVIKRRPYGWAHDAGIANLPTQPQDPNFTPGRNDILIQPTEHHAVQNPHPRMLLLDI